MMAAHVTEAPAPIDALRPGLPRPLAALVMRCLAQRPDDRPANAQAVVDALDAAATPNGGLPAVRRARPAGMVLVASVVLLALLGGWYAWSRPASAAARAATGRGRVVVAPFENLTGDPSLDV